MDAEEKIAPTDQIILEDNTRYFYTIRPFEFTNALGNVIAVLQEFIFLKSIDDTEQFCYKLYKTKDGNWYDIMDGYAPDEYKVLRRLKTAIDMRKIA